jgi:16S rRNA (guanine(527)-N(7))-methyltransferase RsmG
LDVPLNDLKTVCPGITGQQIGLLSDYAALLERYNRKLNLVSRVDVQNLWRNHFLPSLLINNLLPFPSGVEVLDFGTGGGLPGIPLKILRPDLSFVLLDSSHKKTVFLQLAIRELGLSGVDVVRRRITGEEKTDPLHGRFKVIIARAVADFRDLFALTGPLLRREGFLLAWKGGADLASLKDEMSVLKNRYRVIPVPEEFWACSKKFEQLRYIQVFLHQKASGASRKKVSS